jgi:ATP-dependent RNA helicase RhlE
MELEKIIDHKFINRALKDLGLKEATLIQERAFNPITSGKDVVGIAQTGTGKTFAYLLPLLKLWKYDAQKLPQILILVPTRELVVQVLEQVQKVAIYMNLDAIGVYGGTSMHGQKQAVIKGTDVIVATPGRLLDLALDGSLKMKSIKKLVIDEVDEMFALGFRAQLVRVLEYLPNKRQNLMFSATLTEEVENIINDYFIQPIKIEAAPAGTPIAKIKQTAFNVPHFNTKINFIKHLLTKDEDMKKVLVFLSNKRLADLVYNELQIEWKEKVGIIHSDKTQPQRLAAVKQFANGMHRVLIASDLVARGVDITDVSDVINFDLPEQAEQYIHRIGRTGRADKGGNAITFISKKDSDKLKAIEALMGKKLKASKIPELVPISDELIADEIVKPRMKIIQTKASKVETKGAAFHEKKEKNKKVNNKVRRGDALKAKYGKSKTVRGKKRH